MKNNNENTDFIKQYKGKYRLKCHIDQSTNDFPRNASGSIETNDVYIKCKYGCQIYHYGKDILVAYIPSIGRGHNILKSLGERLCNIKYNENYTDYNILYEALHKQGTILHVMENDEEIEFYFNSKNIDLISEYLQPQTFGANINPFSTKNLPKSHYKIPSEDTERYKKIISSVTDNNALLISRITKFFINHVMSKNIKFKEKNISQEMKKQMLKGKEFIHSNGFWNQYLEYLQEEISNEKSSKI